MKRKQSKYLYLALLVFLMGVLVAGSLIIQDAVRNTDDALRMRLPAVATINLNENRFFNEIEMHGDYFDFPRLTPPIIREIGSLGYVKAFDYSLEVPHFFSEIYNRVFIPELFYEYFEGEEIAEPVDWLSTRTQYFESEIFSLTGVQYADILAIESGLIELHKGRTFTQEEIYTGANVVVVSQEFLNENNLSLGDDIILDYRVFYFDEYAKNPHEPLATENLAANKTYELEIVGTFTHELQTIHGFMEIDDHFRRLNTIFAPNRLVETVTEVYVEAFRHSRPHLLEEWFQAENLYDVLSYGNPLFLLHDPLYLRDFRIAVEDLLSEIWSVDDLTSTYQNFTNAMITLDELVGILLILTSIAMIVAFGLLVIMDLQNRRKEIGIYLSLGQKQSNIFKQFILELTGPILIGTTMALLFGNIAATNLAGTMLENELEILLNQNHVFTMSSETVEGMGFRHEISPEEFFEIFELRLDWQTAGYFYLIILIVVLITLLIVYIQIKKVSPMELLKDVNSE